MKKMRKCLILGIILLFVGVIIAPAIAQNIEKSQSASRGNWLYVGGSGPGNYSRIYSAIFDSSPGDTIYVYNGTYYETLFINVTSLTLIGEDRDGTIIDSNSTTAVHILQSYVVIQGFTIIAYENFSYTKGISVANGLQNVRISNNNLSTNNYGISIAEYNNFHRIENNVFYSNFYGISVGSFHIDGYCVIRNNTFVDNNWGIDLSGAYHEISNNKFFSCKRGIEQHGGATTFSNNIFIENDIGLKVGSENNIIGNHFEKSRIALNVYDASNMIVHQNNFINNKKDATFAEESRSHGNNWDDNYWSGSFCPFGCKIIFGSVQTRIPTIFQLHPDPDVITYYWIPWINLDRHPAQEPYDIPGMS